MLSARRFLLLRPRLFSKSFPSPVPSPKPSPIRSCGRSELAPMDRSTMAATEQRLSNMQIYPPPSSSSSGRLVSPFWREKYERDARKYWDIFYKRHEDKFFKDRHYLDKEWGQYFQLRDGEKIVVLEVGCGAGNTIFPLLSTYPYIFVHACDFSPRAVDLVKKHKDFSGRQINAFVCDITVENLTEIVEPSSVDIVTMIFVLSAVAPEKMPLVVHNVSKVLKHGGRVLFRDYAFGDLAQERLMCKGQEISENFYVRGDGTCAYYFPNGYLTDLFTKCGFVVEEISVHNKQVENRSLELVMNRNWIQAVFTLSSTGLQGTMDKPDFYVGEGNEYKPSSDASKKRSNDIEIDLSEDFGNMFGVSHTIVEAQVIAIKVKGHNFKIKALTKEYQHTCKSTGLMLWESAQFMCTVVAENPSIVAGKKVLELGCGSSGICSMVAADFAQLVVATDGDAESLDLLRQNTSCNLEPNLLGKILVRKLFWGNREDSNAVKELPGYDKGFDCIIGTDVTYNPDAILPLFKTARELICHEVNGHSEPALILCYIQRRVDEDSILSTAMSQGFRLVDMWINGVHDSNGIISSWFCGNNVRSAIPNAPLSILYFGV